MTCTSVRLIGSEEADRRIQASTSSNTIAVFLRSVPATLALLCSLAAPALANTYYVSQSGSDSNSCATARNTAASSQKLTIAAGVACLSAGETLYIHGGTYSGSNNQIDSQTSTVRSGTSFSAAVTIAGQPGETVIIRPPANVSGIRLTTGAPAYMIFQDFIIDMVNSTSPGRANAADGVYLSSGAHHNRFLRLEVKNNSANGFQFSDANANSPSNEVINCSIHDNGSAAGTNNGYGLYIETSDNVFEGNDVYNNGGYGFHLYNNGGPKNVNRNIVRNNRIHGNGTHGGTNYGIVTAWGAGNMIYNNVIYGNRGGILVYTESRDTAVYNNTVYNNRPLEGIALQYYASAPTVENNISYGNGTEIVDYGGNGSPKIDHNLTRDPMFVKPEANDFTLKSGSAAEDAGTTIGWVVSDFAGAPRPQGAAYDIGAFEFGGFAAPAAPKALRVLAVTN